MRTEESVVSFVTRRGLFFEFSLVSSQAHDAI